MLTVGEHNRDILCIYHGNCADGFGAAWAVRKRYGDRVDFHPGVYQESPPDVVGKDVIIVDFSYKRAVMEVILEEARTITILDHHKTAIEDLLPIKHLFFDAVFDQTRSGAMIAWNYFHESNPPQLLKHIQDHDLWQFKLLGTREIQAEVFSYPYDFTVWDMLMEADTEFLRREGVAIERKHFKDIRELLTKTRQRLYFYKNGDATIVNAANLPYTLSSDAGHIMVEEDKEPFGCCFWTDNDNVVFSLRSVDGGIDVSEIAKSYGGGGHRNAAGFRVSLEQFTEMLPPV